LSSLRASRRERKKDETRERITRVAVRLFMDRGFDATTVDDIARKADVARGTFFNYFPRKESVLVAFADQHLDHMEALTAELLARKGPARPKILAFATAMTGRYTDNRDLSRIFVSHLMTRLDDPMHRLPSRGRALLASIIAQGQKQGDLRAAMDPDLAASVIQGVALGTLLLWLSGDAAAFALPEELGRRVSLVLDGLSNPTEQVS
jgi:AcrR family transcriptional regulator